MDNSMLLETLEPRLLLSAFVVDSLADSHDANPGDGVARDAQGRITLRAAIEEANKSPSTADSITFANGLSGWIFLTNGQLFIDGKLTITGPANDLLSIDARYNSRVMWINYSSQVSISNLEITGGQVSDDDGGGIYNIGELTLNNVDVNFNQTIGEYSHGGGIFSEVYATTRIYNSIVHDNTASGGGGGIFDNHSTVIVDQSTVEDNRADSGGGFYSSGTLTITQSSINGNEAEYGGGINLNSGTPGPGYATISDSFILGNESTVYSGGGINAGGEQLTITNTRIAMNQSAGHGGGIDANAGEFIHLTDVVFSDNYANFGGAIATNGGNGAQFNIDRTLFITNEATTGDGGAIYNQFSPMNITNSSFILNRALGYGYRGQGGALYCSTDVEIHIANSTFSNNQANTQGGGIHFFSFGEMLFSRNNTIVANIAPTGGGIYAESEHIKLFNTIVAYNATLDFSAINDVYGDFNSASRYNLISNIDGSTGLDQSYTTQYGTTGNELDPKLLPLNLGDPMPYHGIQAGSPVIDRGGNNFAIDPDNNVLTTDQLGNIRRQDGDANGSIVVDIGAIESPSLPGEIHGLVFDDLNGNGIRDNDEPSIPGTIVYLDLNKNYSLDSGEQSTTTDLLGQYSFVDLPIGDYEVRQVKPSGYRQTTPYSLPTSKIDTSFGDQGMVDIDLSMGSSDSIPGIAALSNGKTLALADDMGNDLWRIVRLNADGTIDTEFGDNGYVTQGHPSSGWVETAHALSAYDDGRFVVVGRFGNDWAIARYLADGTVDTAFGGGLRVFNTPDTTNTGMYGLKIQNDGKVVVAGSKWSGGECKLVRFNTNGELDESFGNNGVVTALLDPNANSKIWDMAIDHGGNVVVAGEVFHQQNVYDIITAKFLPDGSLDMSYGENGIQIVDVNSTKASGRGIDITADNKIVLTGFAHLDDPLRADWVTVRLNSDGSMDTTFSDDGYDFIDYAKQNDFPHDVQVQPDGKIIVAGQLYIVGEGYEFAFARYNTDGTLDNSFDSDGLLLLPSHPAVFEQIRTIDLQPDGNLVALGGYSDDVLVMRLNLDTSILSHNITLTSGQTVTGVDFGNQLIGQPPNADFNGDGKVSLLDLDILGRNYQKNYNDITMLGDANGDGVVGLIDLDILGRNFNQPGTPQQGDFTGNGYVTLADLDILGKHFGLDATDTHALGDANHDGIVGLLDLDILGQYYNQPAALLPFHTLADWLNKDDELVLLF